MTESQWQNYRRPQSQKRQLEQGTIRCWICGRYQQEIKDAIPNNFVGDNEPLYCECTVLALFF